MFIVVLNIIAFVTFSCSNDEINPLLDESSNFETLLNVPTNTKENSLISTCVSHQFFPPITIDYSLIPTINRCTVSFNINNIIHEINPGNEDNVRVLVQVIENPIDHPDSTGGDQGEIFNFSFEINEITDNTFDIVHSTDNIVTSNIIDLVTANKNLKVSIGLNVINGGVFCNPFRPENVFFTTTNNCPF